MKRSHEDLELCIALFTMAQQDRRASLRTLCSETGSSPKEVRQRLLVLEEAGLVDARRVRLTMHGLVLAAAVGGERARRGQAGLSVAA